MDTKEYLTNKNFCPIPWTGFMYFFNGDVKNCVRSAGKLGNIKNNTIQEILTGASNCATQANMLAKQPGATCHPCYKLEQNKNSFDIISDRVFYIKELRSANLSTYDTVGNFDLHQIDVRWTNLCNFACVYCNADFSSRWATELNTFQDYPDGRARAQLKEFIFNKVDTLKHVYLAGGEPLLMKENLELLTLLKERNPDVNLRINTNLSKVDTKIFDLVCEFKNVHWIVSVESTEQEYEYIRYGGRWVDFLDNLETIRKLDHKISFNMLHFLLNYLSIFDCIDLLKEKGFHNNSFIIGPVSGPEHLNIRHLPTNVLNLVECKLDEMISTSPGYLLEDGLRNMYAYITAPYEKNIEYSLHKIQELDQRRGIDSRQVFSSFYKSLGE